MRCAALSGTWVWVWGLGWVRGLGFLERTAKGAAALTVWVLWMAEVSKEAGV